jgi:hypothetical protein
MIHGSSFGLVIQRILQHENERHPSIMVAHASEWKIQQINERQEKWKDGSFK